jgi:hypothetical protein
MTYDVGNPQPDTGQAQTCILNNYWRDRKKGSKWFIPEPGFKGNITLKRDHIWMCPLLSIICNMITTEYYPLGEKQIKKSVADSQHKPE